MDSEDAVADADTSGGRYIPRTPFIAFHERGERLAKIVAHRRCGKTVAAINELIRGGLTNQRVFPEPNYAYVAPTYSQAKDISWRYLKRYGAMAIENSSENELWVQLRPTHARIRLYGSDNIDRMRGLYFDGVVLDEPAQMHPDVWPVSVYPTLADYNGWATFIGTPRGKDWFYRVDLRDDETPKSDWFRAVLRASQTGILSPATLATYQEALSRDQYAQEFECSFEAALAGAYYAQYLTEAQKQGRIGQLAADPLLPLWAYFDIGGAGATSDATSIWLVQHVSSVIRVLDYVEGAGQAIGHYADILRKRGHDRAVCVFPHDGANTDAMAKRYVDHWRDAGFECREPIPNMGRGAAMQRIEAVRRLFPKMYFDDIKTKSGRQALEHYHEHWDLHRRIGLGPMHDWSSHAADAFGLMAICYKEPTTSAGFERDIAYPELGLY